jgi:hypothetical protein
MHPRCAARIIVSDNPILDAIPLGAGNTHHKRLQLWLPIRERRFTISVPATSGRNARPGETKDKD